MVADPPERGPGHVVALADLGDGRGLHVDGGEPGRREPGQHVGIDDQVISGDQRSTGCGRTQRRRMVLATTGVTDHPIGHDDLADPQGRIDPAGDPHDQQVVGLGQLEDPGDRHLSGGGGPHAGHHGRDLGPGHRTDEGDRAIGSRTGSRCSPAAFTNGRSSGRMGASTAIRRAVRSAGTTSVCPQQRGPAGATLDRCSRSPCGITSR